MYFWSTEFIWIDFKGLNCYRVVYILNIWRQPCLCCKCHHEAVWSQAGWELRYTSVFVWYERQWPNASNKLLVQCVQKTSTTTTWRSVECNLTSATNHLVHFVVKKDKHFPEYSAECKIICRQIVQKVSGRPVDCNLINARKK